MDALAKFVMAKIALLSATYRRLDEISATPDGLVKPPRMVDTNPVPIATARNSWLP